MWAPGEKELKKDGVGWMGNGGKDHWLGIIGKVSKTGREGKIS